MKLPSIAWANQDSPYLLQYRDGFRLLRFADGLEQRFRRYHGEVFLGRMRWGLLVAALLFLLFAALDALSLPESVRRQTLFIRLGLIVPMLQLASLATFSRRLRDSLQLISGVCSLYCGLGIVGIIWVARLHAFPLPYEGIILATVFFYFLTGLRLLAAALCGWLTFLGYLLVEVNTGLPGAVLLYSLFFLATANVIGSVGCYFLEYASRQNFLAQGLLQEVAEKDALTGLFNRRAFAERAEAAWRQALRDQQPVALAMLDVDFFKRYNDLYGHAAGDEALRALAQVLGRYARRPLDVVARYGGEEFVGFWYGLNEADILQILEEVRAEVERLGVAHARSDVAPVLTLSIGLAWQLPQAHQSLADALRLADVALYLAKEQGRNRLVGKRPGSSQVA